MNMFLIDYINLNMQLSVSLFEINVRDFNKMAKMAPDIVQLNRLVEHSCRARGSLYARYALKLIELHDPTRR
jgi:hypothetical protein